MIPERAMIEEEINHDHEVIIGICVVDFHHTRGPEVEYWCGLPEGTDESKLWPNLPFQALPDGSHSFKETFTYFTLLYNKKTNSSPQSGATDLLEKELSDYTTLFAVSCSQQISSEELITKDKDVTRSTVQKAIVIVSYQPIFGQIKDKLSIVTNVFFSQRNFSDRQIIVSLYDNVNFLFKPLSTSNLSDSHLYVGLCLRKIILDFKKDALVLLKALLLEKKIIFYGKSVETLCNLQFGLISLIPNLISNLQDSGSPLLYRDTEAIIVADSFRSSDRSSVLKFMGFPLQVFENGGLFSPYTPLQQVDDIKDEKTKFFVIGTSNSLLAERREELCQIYVDTDESSIEVIDKSLQQMLQLSYHDKKWIESIALIVTESWNENDQETPKNSQFEGSEDFIRWQFEDYLIGVLSSAKLSDYLQNHKGNERALQSVPEEMKNCNAVNFFNINWVNEWKGSQNYRLFSSLTDDRLFDLFAPKHVFNGTDTLKVLQQKLVSAFQNLKKNNNSSDSISEKKEQKREIKAVESLSTASTRSGSQNSNAKDFTNRWNAFKELFNKKRNPEQEENKEGAQDALLSTESLLVELSATKLLSAESASQEHSPSNIEDNEDGKPSVGLGLHYDNDIDNKKLELHYFKEPKEKEMNVEENLKEDEEIKEDNEENDIEQQDNEEEEDENKLQDEVNQIIKPSTIEESQIAEEESIPDIEELYIDTEDELEAKKVALSEEESYSDKYILSKNDS